MYILGISCFYHDSAAAILKDGVLVAAAEEERFSRRKHDYGFPVNAIAFCLGRAGISGSDLDYVVFYEKTFLKFERILMSSLQMFPKSSAVFSQAMLTWLLDKIWIKNAIRNRLAVDEKRILFVEHHYSHAGSCFLCSPFEEAAILTVDGVGEWTTTAFGTGRKNTICLEKEMRFPHSLGLLYSAFTAFLGFEVNEGEYKVMGMASFGKPRYVDKIYQVVRIQEDGSFFLDMDYFSYHYSSGRTYSRKFERLFGKSREPEAHFFTSLIDHPVYFGKRPENYRQLEKENQYYADVAASIQEVTEEILVKMAKHLHRQTGLKKLCLAGGVALNSTANRKILRETPFEELYIQPAAGDSGGALGAALYANTVLLNQPRRFVMEHVFWGAEYREAEIKEFLEDNWIPYEYIDQEEKLLERATDCIQREEVVGWFQGRSEWGPRALGNRSIIADPRKARMKDVVNMKIKFREPFRPFGPSVLVENAEEFFDLPGASSHYPARFMLYVADVKEGKREIIPAVTHVDGTSRFQTVFPKTSPRYYRLIKMFAQATGVPALLNTSFNLKGEPIVNTPADAFRTFSKSGMNTLILGNFLVRKR